MKKHIVQSGEGLSKLAEQCGFLPDTIWNHPANADLKARRKDGNVLLPGDELVIPDRVGKMVQVAVGATHRFKKRGVPALLRLQLFKNDAPRANAPCSLELDDGYKLERTTDADGCVEFHVPPRVGSARLRVERDAPVRIELGTLDPVDTLTGVQRRLRNLGLYHGACDGADDESFRVALRVFQRRCALRESGEADAPTIARLREIHDGSAHLPEEPR